MSPSSTALGGVEQPGVDAGAWAARVAAAQGEAPPQQRALDPSIPAWAQRD